MVKDICLLNVYSVIRVDFQYLVFLLFIISYIMLMMLFSVVCGIVRLILENFLALIYQLERCDL